MNDPRPNVAMIEAEAVTKWYGDVVAVSGVSFAVGPGVTALLGPNGAGKSTLLRMIAGQAPPSEGKVRVLGGDPRLDAAVKARVGLAPQQEGMIPGISALRFVELAASLTGVDRPDERARWALETVELADVGHLEPVTFSKGMKQRVKLAQALATDPDVLLLDEPLTGLDPAQRNHFIDLVVELGAQGRCVLISSHVLDEVERFGSRILVVAQGRLAAVGDFRAIRDLMDDHPHRIRLRVDDPRRLATRLLDLDGVRSVELEPATYTQGPALVVQTTKAVEFRRTIAGHCIEAGVSIEQIQPLDDDLDSVFRYLIEP
ncbi:MAG: ABC transporter ATP-binding protein [Acidimicrobiales bacterium]|nr:ABC transporter ATP-binding protein [Acidimicrobiales bacterium]